MFHLDEATIKRLRFYSARIKTGGFYQGDRFVDAAHAV